MTRVYFVEFMTDVILKEFTMNHNIRLPNDKEEIYLKDKRWRIHAIVNNLDNLTVQYHLVEIK